MEDPASQPDSMNTTIHLAKRPKEGIVSGETFEVRREPIPKREDVKDGQVLVKVEYLSVDPAMRGWLNDVRSYVPPVGIGEKMRGATLATVLYSKAKGIQAGDTVIAPGAGWCEYAITSGVQKITPPPGATAIDFLSVLGFTGLTAYFGLLDICDPKSGETVVVSGAAGAVGMAVAQIAKIKGCRVIGIAGGAEKCRFLKEELGLDEVLDYKAENFKQALAQATPKYINIYFDNVGGSILEECLGRAANHARFALCGAISQYNSRKPVGPRNFNNIIAQRIKVEGFIVLDYEKQFAEAQREMAGWLKSGKLKRREWILEGGIEKAEEGLQALFEGKNLGKCLIKVAKEKSRL